jgi:hypothetical protein
VELAVSIPTLIQNATPTGFRGAGLSGVNWTEPFLYLNVSVNLTFTVVIVARLLAHRHYIRSVIGSKHASHYTGVAAMLIESSAIYGVVALCFAILLARGSPATELFLAPTVQTQVRASMIGIHTNIADRPFTDDRSTLDHVPRWPGQGLDCRRHFDEL